MTRTVMACLWQGEDLPHEYNVEDVANLARNARRHIPGARIVVFVDEFYEQEIAEAQLKSVETVIFSGLGVGGWSNILEVFGPWWWPQDGDRNLFVGLDTVFTGNCDWLFTWDKSPVGLPLDPFHAPLPCDAVVSFDGEGAELVWAAFLESREDGMLRDLYAGRPSEMALLRRLYAQHGWEPLEPEPERLLSYKVHGYTEGASIVYFHGKPKPADLPENDPVKREWQAVMA